MKIFSYEVLVILFQGQSKVTWWFVSPGKPVDLRPRVGGYWVKVQRAEGDGAGRDATL